MSGVDESLHALPKFLYRSPLAAVQTLRDGTIELMTPRAARFLLPLAGPGAALDNLFDLLAAFAPGLRDLASADKRQATLCEGLRISVPAADGSATQDVLALDLVAIDSGHLMAMFHEQSPQERRAEADHRLTRLQLDRLEVQSQQALETMAIAVAREPLDGASLHFDARWRAWLGLPASSAALARAEFAGHIHPDDLPSYEQDRASAVAGQLENFRDFRLRRVDGSWVTLSGRRLLETDPAGGATQLTTFAFDATEQRAAERQRLALAEHLRLATEATGIGSFEWLRPERELLWPPQTYALFGAGAAADGREKPAAILNQALSTPERARLSRWLWRMARRRAAADLEFEISHRDGSRRWLAAKAQPRLDAQGRIGSVIGVVWDVTERRAGEAALEARRVAEQANRAKSEFLSRMSHELRTPLNAILGFSEVMQRSPDFAELPRQKHRLDQIHDAGKHLLQLIDDLLDVSRIEVGALRLELASVDLFESAAAACSTLARQARLRGITIDLVPPPEPAFAHADATRLRQVLLNLLSNGIKYNRDHGRIEVGIEACARGWRLSVSDTGIGLDNAQINRLYAPYDRLGRESTAVQGVGIGLTITRQLVLAMGGEITVHSEPGQGSCFAVELPRAPAPETGAGNSAEAPQTRDQPRGRLLLVEDNEADAALLHSVLEWRPGIAIELARTAAQAMRLAARSQPDLLLLDLLLPDLPGSELLRLLRADPVLREVPCIVVSAAAMPEQAAAARAAGADLYLTKPVAAPRLLAAIDGLLGSRRSAAEVSQA